MNNPNLKPLIDAARLLRPVLDELVFVGGCVTGLLISDKAATGVRPTFDVDVITEATTYTEYAHLSERLRKLGFVEDTGEGAPLCRWFNGDTRLDVMPLDEKILGFSNPWYVPAIETAQAFELEKGFYIRVLTAPYFCATKIVAFKDRGHGDYLSSHDLEDVITVVDGRPELLAELQSAPHDVRHYVASAIGELLDAPQFVDALPGYLLSDAASQGRIGSLLAILEQISKL
jgi:hypothetical protein